MAKVRLIRYSGEPVKLEARDQYQTAWREFYDKAQKKAGLDMLKLQRFLRYGERLLQNKYGQTVEIEMPKSSSAWGKLVSSYEDTPIMVARAADGRSQVLVIMDVPLP